MKKDELWPWIDGVYKLTRPEIVRYPQNPVKVKGKLVERPDAEFTIVSAEKIEDELR